jgi:hypothetical protein
MAERIAASIGLKPRTFPGWVPLGPQEPPIVEFPTEKATPRIGGLIVPPSSEKPFDRKPFVHVPLVRLSPARIDEFLPLPLETQQEKREPMTSLEENIRNNFALSFDISPESRELQEFLLAMINSQYNSQELRNEFGTWEEFNRRMKPHIADIQLSEAFIDTQDPDGEIASMWAVQSEILRAHFDDGYQSPPDSMIGKFSSQTLESQEIDIVSLMVTTDEEVVEQKIKDTDFDKQSERPETIVGKDPFESRVKKYLIDLEPSGSAEYDLLFASLSTIMRRALVYDPSRDEGKVDLAFSSLAMRLRKIRKLWEKHHHGERFSSIVPPKQGFYINFDEEPDYQASFDLWKDFDGLPGDEGEIFPEN